jgi:ABC-2 type transport system permease protein
LFLVGSIVIIAIISVANLPLDSFRGPFMQTWLNGLAFLTLALVGFVMAALSARFQFAAVSNEGRGFWVTRTAPVSAKEFLWAKAYPGFLPMLLVGEILAISSTSILDAQSSLIWLGIGTALFLSFGLSGIAVGMGALYPDFKIDSSAKLAATPAGLLYMVTALSLVFLVLALEAPSVYFLISSQITGRIITNIEWGLAIGALVLAASTCVFATFYPIQKGAQKLWERELPNG